MSRGRSQRGYAPAFVVFSLVGGVFLYLVAYQVAGWWGVAGLAGFVTLVSLVLRSQVTASSERQRRADERWVSYYAAYGPVSPPRPRPRRARRARRARGGVR
ncbi:hypothetical protein [Nocardia carnea]|uniref:hypothetical protein n=1 Tax=Nocardia carnea TaxID=37328 RepID=UPI0024545781|nr:hypothetical protein [Nocardia carnea]